MFRPYTVHRQAQDAQMQYLYVIVKVLCVCIQSDDGSISPINNLCWWFLVYVSVIGYITIGADEGSNSGLSLDVLKIKFKKEGYYKILITN
jgi:hypothetical protein